MGFWSLLALRLHLHLPHAFARARPHLFEALRSEAVGGRAKQWPVPLPSARAEERSVAGHTPAEGQACS